MAADTTAETDLGVGGTARVQGAAVGWFDADAQRDLGVAVGSTLRILRGTEDGGIQTFTEGGEAFEIPMGDPFKTPPVLAADLTQDGRHELIFQWNVAITDPDGAISTLESAPVTAWFVADLNGDTVLDLMSVGESTVGFFAGLGGDLLFEEGVIVELEVNADKHTFGDFDGDGLLDFVAIDNDTVGPGVVVPAQVQVYRGLGDGTFVPAMAPLELGLYRYVGTAGDLDCDGRDELLIASEGVTIYEMEGDALMQVGFIDAPRADELEVADFNGDGVFDLALRDRVVDLEEFTISVMPGVGDGTFHPRVQLSSNLDNRLLGVADLDGDNRFSVIVGDGSALRLYDVQ